jgi:OOP family OmpA-OmpF porin
LFAVAENVNAQNLVPNPGFETYSACPNDDLLAGTIRLARPWNKPTDGSSDYFHTCSTAPATTGVPTNRFGNQTPHSGNAYAGFYTYIGQQNVREYIQAPLRSPLVAGQSYNVSFYVSLADVSKWAIDGMGAHFSKGPVGIYGTAAKPWHSVLPLVPQVSNPTRNVISDKTNWTLVQGSFCARGGENNIVIGNFKDDATVTVTNMTGTENSAYYYIDDVSVVARPGVCPPVKACKVAGPCLR